MGTSILGVTECLGIKRYLGMLLLVGWKKNDVFNFVKEKVWQKIQSWNWGWKISDG